LRHSEELGATVRHGWEAHDAIFEGNTVVGVVTRDPDGNRHEIRARVVVDATGRDTLMASRICLKQRLPGLDKTAIFSHYTGVARQSGREEGHIDIVVFPHGWFWNIPFRGEVNSFGVVCSSKWIRSRRPGESLDQFFDRTVEDAVWAERLLSHATRLNPVRALADYSYRVDSYGGNGWVMVGDSMGFIDPLFSTGAHLAFSSGALAADEIIAALGSNGDVSAQRWQAYEQSVRRASELFVGAVQAFYDDTLAELIFEQPQRKVLRQTITSMLAGDVFNPDIAWARYLRERYPASLPTASTERAPAGATPMVMG
jgi:flavin-dependent dehydrogenase